MPLAIDHHALAHEHVAVVVAAFAAPQQRANPLQQHLHAERLGHVVVGADREADHLVGLLGLRREHQHEHVARHRVGPQPAANLQAVDHRQHQIEHDQIGRAQPGLPQAVLAVVGHGRLVAVLAQVVIQHLGQRPIVFDDENLSLWS